MLDGLLQFGLGAAIIGLFFVPYVRYKDKVIAEKDKEIAALNDAVKSVLNNKYDDLKQVLLPVTEQLKQFKNTSDLILQELLKRNG